MEEEIKNLKAVAEAFAQEKVKLDEKVSQLTDKKDVLGKHIKDVCEEFSEKLVSKFFFGRVKSAYCQKLSLDHLLIDYPSQRRALLEQGTGAADRDLDPTRLLVPDNAALAILRLEDRVENALGFITRAKGAAGRIDEEPGEETQKGPGVNPDAVE